MGKFFFALSVLAVCCVWPVGCVVEKEGAGDFVEVGDPVPEFGVVAGDATGLPREFSRADFVGKRSLVIFFWTPCKDCRRELPVIHEAWSELSDRADFQLVAVSRGEKAEDVAEYWNSESEGKPSFAPMPYWLDPDESAFHAFADSYVPRMYLVDSSGKIAAMSVEKFDLDAVGLVELIEGLE